MIGNQEGFIRDDVNGVVYIGEGCWGAPLRPVDDNKFWTRHSGSFNQIKWIFIDQSKIEIRTIKTDNADIVGSLKDKNRFTMPLNINIWTPAPNEDIITIYKTFSTNGPSIIKSDEKKLYLYPNPVGENLHLEIDILPNLYPIRIEIWDYSGKNIFSNI